MDFRGRVNQSSGRPSAPVASQPDGSGQSFVSGSATKSVKKPAKLFRVGALLLLFSVTGLVIALTFLLAFHSDMQKDAILKDKYQAVFLNNGQVYFGKIASVGGPMLDLRGIYYLQTNGTASGSTTTPSTTDTNVSLVKLGCELHAPYDQMLINSDQVIFWENIQDSSQVVKAIDAYKKTNGSKITCDTTSQNSTQQAPATSSSTGTGTSSTTGTSSSTTGTSTITKKP